MMAEMDTDHDGVTSHDEMRAFLDRYPKWLLSYGVSSADELIAIIDKNSDGRVNRSELMVASCVRARWWYGCRRGGTERAVPAWRLSLLRRRTASSPKITPRAF